VEDSFRDQPLIEARLRMTLGNSFGFLGEYKLAVAQLEAARVIFTRHRGVEHPDTLRSMNMLTSGYVRLGRNVEALKLAEETLSLCRGKLGPDHPNTLATMHTLGEVYFMLARYEEAAKLQEEVLAIAKGKLGADAERTLLCMNNLASSYFYLGRRGEALKLREEALGLEKVKLGPAHPMTLAGMYYLADSYAALGRAAEALKLREEVLALRKAKLGLDHPDTHWAIYALATSLVLEGRAGEAIPLIDDYARRVTSPDANARILLGFRIRHFEKANDAAACRATAEMLERLNPTDSNGLYAAACLRAVTAAVERAADGSPEAATRAAAEADRAMEWLGKAVAAGFVNVGPMMKDADLQTLRHRADFQKLLAALEAKVDENIAAARDAVRREPNDVGRTRRLASMLNDLSWGLATRPDPARRDATKAVTLADELVTHAPNDANYWNTLGVARYRAGDFRGAIDALKKYRELRTDNTEWSNPFFLAMAYWGLGNKDEARRWYGIAVEWMDKHPAYSTATMKRFRSEAAELLGVNEAK
jgi:tetratricopeptide (TPR) repeat protein